MEKTGPGKAGRGGSFDGLVLITPTHYPQFKISRLDVRLSCKGLAKKNFYVL